LVDETALLAALERGAPQHAVLDVFQKEPQPPDGPFWDHPQVTLTGHTAGMCSGLPARNHTLFVDNLERYLSDRPLLNEVAPSDVLDV
jgi:glyoxylate/hydroxypyruvate reductase A